jgi:hypothetical protein
MSVMSIHSVAIKFETGNAIAVPSVLNDMNDGDTLQINSSDGTFRIVFKPWPFEGQEHEVTTDAPLTFQNKGEDQLSFQFFCYITPNITGEEVGYPGTSGGHGSVNPPGHP